MTQSTDPVPVSLTPAQIRLLRDLEKDDRSDPQGLLDAALSRLAAGPLDDTASTRRKIQLGLEDLRAGRVMDADAFFREWDAELDALRSS